MSPRGYDAIIIGGGPGGSAAATYLARAGKRVLVLEKDHFPRFHIGESLLPYNLDIFEEMGVLPKLAAAGFTRKLGAQFHLGNSSGALKLTFQNGRFTRFATAFQVERASFDQLLLNHARACGAEVREGWAVTNWAAEARAVDVEAQPGDGQKEYFHGAYLIDASGRGNLTGNREGLRTAHSRLKKLAVFGHFEGVRTDEGSRAGDILIVRLENKWFWLIPLSGSKVSVGCVLEQKEFAESRRSPAEAFEQAWQSSSEMRSRMKDARLAGDLHSTADFSYFNRRLTGPRLLRVGDAAGFIDPVFSSGVYLAMHTARLASRTVLKLLAGGASERRCLKRYEREVFRTMRPYWELVEGFYTTPFMELLMQPRAKFGLSDAIIATLAGDVPGNWKLAWRRRLFFWLARLQARVALVPRISFQENQLSQAPCAGEPHAGLATAE